MPVLHFLLASLLSLLQWPLLAEGPRQGWSAVAPRLASRESLEQELRKHVVLFAQTPPRLWLLLRPVWPFQVAHWLGRWLLVFTRHVLPRPPLLALVTLLWHLRHQPLSLLPLSVVRLLRPLLWPRVAPAWLAAALVAAARWRERQKWLLRVPVSWHDLQQPVPEPEKEQEVWPLVPPPRVAAPPDVDATPLLDPQVTLPLDEQVHEDAVETGATPRPEWQQQELSLLVKQNPPNAQLRWTLACQAQLEQWSVCRRQEPDREFFTAPWLLFSDRVEAHRSVLSEPV